MNISGQTKQNFGGFWFDGFRFGIIWVLLCWLIDLSSVVAGLVVLGYAAFGLLGVGFAVSGFTAADFATVGSELLGLVASSLAAVRFRLHLVYCPDAAEPP